MRLEARKLVAMARRELVLMQHHAKVEFQALDRGGSYGDVVVYGEKDLDKYTTLGF